MFFDNLFVRAFVLVLAVVITLLQGEARADETGQDVVVTEEVATDPAPTKVLVTQSLSIGDFAAIDVLAEQPLIGNFIGVSYSLNFTVSKHDTLVTFVGCYIDSLPLGDVGCGTGLTYSRLLHPRWTFDTGVSLYNGLFVNKRDPATYMTHSAFVTFGGGVSYIAKHYMFSVALAQASCDVNGAGCLWMPSVGVSIPL